MHSEKDLAQDFLMEYHNVHGKNCRIHTNTYYRAKRRMVVQETTCTRLRFLKFLPPKVTVQEETLKIPLSVTTEEELYSYVEDKKPYWLRDRRY